MFVTIVVQILCWNIKLNFLFLLLQIVLLIVFISRSLNRIIGYVGFREVDRTSYKDVCCGIPYFRTLKVVLECGCNRFLDFLRPTRFIILRFYQKEKVGSGNLFSLIYVSEDKKGNESFFVELFGKGIFCQY